MIWPKSYKIYIRNESFHIALSVYVQQFTLLTKKWGKMNSAFFLFRLRVSSIVKDP
jgi:hypothetical protein